MNNKGFTLIELLAVLVILTAIMSIALPSITSSMERTKSKQDGMKKQLLESYAEGYVTDHKNAIYIKMGSNVECYITIDVLKQEGYLADDAEIDSSGKELKGVIVFKKPNTFTYQDSKGSLISCVD